MNKEVIDLYNEDEVRRIGFIGVFLYLLIYYIMAIFRKVHTSFWSDPFTSELDKDKKLFYLYLITNERTKQCGIYEISKRQISFDLGYTIDTVSKLLAYFIENGKIYYSNETNEIALKNWAKYNYSTSPKVVKCIESELLQVKNRVLIEYVNGMDTLSQEEQEEEQEESKPQEVIDFVKLLAYINSSFGRKFKTIDKSKYKSLLKNGYNNSDIQHCIDNLKTIQYHVENNYQYCTPEFISRPATMEKYSTVSSVTAKPRGEDAYHSHVMKQVAEIKNRKQ
jgi:hypothetical protein